MAVIGVSGTGIAGMAAALAAANAGHDVLHFGKAADIPAKGGVQIAPNGWAALRRLGLGAAAEAESTRLDSITVRALDSGATLISLPLRDSYASFSRMALSELLQTALADAPSVTRITHSLTHIRDLQNATSVITDDGMEHRLDGLIAADGTAGPGRQHVVSGQPAPPSQKRVAMRAQIPLASLPTHFSHAGSHLWLGRGCHVVHYPIDDNLNLVATLPPGWLAADWQQQLLPASSPLAVMADPSVTWMRTSIPTASTAPSWRRGTVVLAGDAAHSMPPHLAQGAGQSLQDAGSLFGWLDGANDIDAAFAGYARERAAAVSRIVQKADISGRIMAWSGPTAQLRDIALNLGGSRLMQSWLAEVWADDTALS